MSLIDITMGGLDGAEKCDLVRLFLPSLLNELKDIKVGLYRGNGAALTKLKPNEAERLKNKIFKVVKPQELDITIQANLESILFLDVKVDLKTGTHKPYIKPNNTLLYIDINCNQSQNVIKNTVPAIEKRLSMLSSNKHSPLPGCLDNSGYKYKLKYEENTTEPSQKSNIRKETWSNPPWSKNVKTPVGAQFLKCVDERFPLTL